MSLTIGHTSKITATKVIKQVSNLFTTLRWFKYQDVISGYRVRFPSLAKVEEVNNLGLSKHITSFKIKINAFF